MKAKHALLATAVLCSLAAQASAEQYKYRLVNQVDAFLDGSKTTTLSATVGKAGKYYQWFGEKTACAKNAVENCETTHIKTKKEQTKWLVGSETTASGGLTWFGSEVNLEEKLKGEYSKTVTDSDAISRKASIEPGKTVEASTFVNRRLVKTTYYGAWVKIESGVKCPSVPKLKCAKYEYDGDKKGNSVSSLVTEDGEEVFLHLTYKTGDRPDYVLEKD
jgi:hypothetical protein